MKKSTAPQAKQPKTIEVRVLTPWIIVIILIMAIVGVVTGWTLRTIAVSETKSAVAAVTTSKE